MIKVVSAFVFGQGLIQAITLGVGLAVVHMLSVEEYALYSLAGAILVVVSMGSDFGVSQAIISIGSKQRDDKASLGALLDAAVWWTRRLMVVATLLGVGFGVLLFTNSKWTASTQIIAITIVIFVGLAQVSLKLGRAVLNIHHDSHSLFKIGLAESGIRAALLPACLIWPFASVMLLINLTGALIARRIALRRAWSLLDRSGIAGSEERRSLFKFAAPLTPFIVYTAFQGQIAILLLSLNADTQSIAELAALSRIGQVFHVIMLLNSFLVQPMFAREEARIKFLHKFALVALALAALSLIVMTSAYLIPEWWLIIIGEKYAHLDSELPLLLATALLTLVGATLHVLVISRGSTVWQSISFLPCLGSQLLFIAFHEVRTTFDALTLILLPAATYAIVQGLLLFIELSSWSGDQRSEGGCPRA
jgi:O-antigen/teichoic acid export membrane protein